MDPSKEREILLDYQYTRDKNLALQEKRIKEINEKYPDIDSLSNDIRMMGLNISKMLFNSCSDEDIETMRYELNSMIKKKSDLFEYYGIPSDYLDLKYRCPICKDTGFLESGDQCKCLKQKILQDSYRMSNLDKILDDSNFDKFNFSLLLQREQDLRQGQSTLHRNSRPWEDLPLQLYSKRDPKRGPHCNLPDSL